MRGLTETATAGGMAHHQALELMASRALAEGDAAAAFALADRRCRIRPAPEAHSFVLRAETHFRLGRRRFALADLERALAIAPEDVAANRRMLSWGRGEARHRAARTLVRVDRDLPTLRAAIAALEKNGEQTFASLRVFDQVVRGWVAWHGDDVAVSVTVAGDLQRATTYIEPDRGHPLAGGSRRAATFEVARASCPGPQAIHVAVGGTTCLSLGAPPNGRPAARPAPAAPSGRVTVIVPVYADFAATRACLDRLVPQLGGSHAAVIVDDAAPDRRMAPYLRGLAGCDAVTLLAHPRNLGFVAAVNAALAAIPAGDVLLLNADTIPPPGLLGRLAAAARTRPDIGIVTALSNDAEMTSFPLPDRANPLASPEDALALDRIAAAVNAGRIVDLPGATGFCLYLTRRCLDAVGPLSAAFHRGYLEDVDLCLRARACGYRTVCDTSVFVGHAGSRSFGAEKAALALRNFAVLAAHHPGYVEACRAFTDADPLRPARAAIERAAPVHPPAPLLVTGTGSLAAIARHHAAARLDGGGAARLLTLAPGPARLTDAAGGMPQSLVFDLATPAGLAALAEALDLYPATTIDILDPASVPPALAGLLAGRPCPLRLVVADGGIAHAPGMPARADAILAPTVEASAFAARLLPPAIARRIATPEPPAGRRKPRRAGRRDRLGIVAPAPDAHLRALLGDLARRLAEAAPGASLVILGEVPGATGLARHGNVTLAGTVAPGELAAAVAHHGAGRLFVERRRPLFGHPLVAAAEAAGLPLAFRDWSFGAPECRPRPRDLAIDPHATEAEAAAAIARWMA